MTLGHGVIATLAVENKQMSRMAGQGSDIDASEGASQIRQKFLERRFAFSDSILRVIVFEGAFANLGGDILPQHLPTPPSDYLRLVSWKSAQFC